MVDIRLDHASKVEGCIIVAIVVLDHLTTLFDALVAAMPDDVPPNQRQGPSSNPITIVFSWFMLSSNSEGLLEDVRPHLDTMVPAGLEATLRDLSLSDSVGSWTIVRDAKIGLVQIDREASIRLVWVDREARVWLVQVGRWRNSSNQSGKRSSDDDGLDDVLKEVVVSRSDEGKVVVFCQEPEELTSRMLISQEEPKNSSDIVVKSTIVSISSPLCGYSPVKVNPMLWELCFLKEV